MIEDPVLPKTQSVVAQPRAEVQPEAASPNTDPQEEAKTDIPADEEGKKKLRATFNAFVASLKEKEREKELVLVTPPPLPLKRPENIPAPVRTAALTADAGVTPRVAVLLRGLGRNDKNSEIAVTTLPSAISLGFAPYVGSAQQWAQQARERGHEVIVVDSGSTDATVASARESARRLARPDLDFRVIEGAGRTEFG